MSTIINPNDQTLATNVSLAVNYTGPWIPLIRNVSYSFQAVWTGSPVGNFSLQSSDDSAANIAVTPTNPTNVLLANGTYTSAAGGAAGDLTIAYQGAGPVPYNWVRFLYTATSGTGTMTSLTFNGK